VTLSEAQMIMRSCLKAARMDENRNYNSEGGVIAISIIATKLFDAVTKTSGGVEARYCPSLNDLEVDTSNPSKE